MTSQALAAVTITAGAYALTLHLRHRWQNPATTPVLVTVVLVIAVLGLGRVPYASYQPGGALISAWLGPATTALAVIMYKHRGVLFENARAALVALTCGSIASMLCAFGLARLFAVPSSLNGVLVLKSVTVAVSSQLAPLAHVATANLAIVVIAVGVIGATIGPGILTLLAVGDPFSRGIALGCISHGIGTAQAATESETTGAASSIAMCLVALALCTVGLPLVIVAGR